ncbi:MAG: AgmX/PglI C-terminal domain-containing protein [Myxococcales bacterium]|nr:AgmX/PglI C-terminal domain-containing protein [Myxococcales bacterium]
MAPTTSSAASMFTAQSSDTFGYRLVKRADLAASEVEDDNTSAIEVMVGWGENLLHVAHLTGKKGFALGEDGDFAVPAEKLGSLRLGLVEDGALIVPEGAKGHVDFGSERLSLDELRASQRLVNGRLPLARGQKARLELAGFTVHVAAVAAGKKLSGGTKRRRALGLWVGSALLHVGIVTALMMSPGNSLDDDSAGLDKSTAAYLMQMQKNNAEHEAKEQESDATAKTDGEKAGKDGKAHAGVEGTMGSPKANVTGGHYEVKGPPDSAEVKLAKTRALIESGNIGAIGALSAVFGANPSAMTSFDGADVTIGRDPNDFQGNMTGDHGGDSWGYNGLGMKGVGPGGGCMIGLCDGIGLGTVGDFGTKGPGNGWETGPGGKDLKHKTKTVKPPVDGTTDITGRLPQETIKRIVHANFPRFRACYETGLKKDPGLRGTVITRFIIDTTGAVESASQSGGTLEDGNVKSCVRNVFAGLSFPEPESGKVMVTYPLSLDNE